MPPACDPKFIGIIVAVSLGGFVLLVLVIAAAVFYFTRRRRRRRGLAVVQQGDAEYVQEVQKPPDLGERPPLPSDQLSNPPPTSPPFAQSLGRTASSSVRAQANEAQVIEIDLQSPTESHPGSAHRTKSIEPSSSRDSIRVAIPLHLLPSRPTLDPTRRIDIVGHNRQASDATLVNPSLSRPPSASGSKLRDQRRSDGEPLRLFGRKRSVTIPVDNGNSRSAALHPQGPRPLPTPRHTQSASSPSTSNRVRQSSDGPPPASPQRLRKKSLRRRAIAISTLEPLPEAADNDGRRSSVDSWWGQLSLQLHTPPASPNARADAPQEPPPRPSTSATAPLPEIIMWGPERRPTLRPLTTSVRRGRPPPQSPIQPYHLEPPPPPPPPPPKDPSRSEEVLPPRPSTAPEARAVTKGNSEEGSDASFGSSKATYGSPRTTPPRDAET